MAFTNSNLGTAQAKLLQLWQEGALKFLNPKTYLSIISQSPIFFPNYEALRTREDRTLTAYYIERAARSIGTAGRIHNHSGTVGTSNSLTPTWVTYDDIFKYSLKQGNINMFSLDEMLNGEIQNVIRNFATGLEAVACNFLFNNRSGVNACTVEGSFDEDIDVFKIALANEKKAGMIINSVMEVNGYGGLINVYCDTVMFNKVLFQSAQSVANSENLAFQYGGKTYIHSVGMNALAAGLGITDGFCVAVQNGLIGVLPHIPKENALGISTKVNEYGTILNPIDGYNYAVHSFEAVGNGTSTGGYAQDVITQVQISIDEAFEDCPLKTSGETVLQAFGLVESVQ